MNAGTLRAKFDELFFKPISPYPLCTFRIALGLCACVTLLLLHSDWLAWFGVHGWISMDTIDKAESGFRLNLFAIIPRDDRWIEGLYWLLLTASVTLAAGLGTRISSFVLYLGLNSLDQRNPLIFHGGETFLRLAAFFMIFAPSGAVVSLDSLIKRRILHTYRLAVPKISPWAQRLIQFQLAIIYLMSFWWKTKGSAWRDGTALYYVVHLREVQRFPLPAIFHLAWVQHLGTWTVMLFELLFPLLVWFKPFRTAMLIAGVLFHLCLEYALNVPIFQWDILSAYVLFVNPLVLQKLLERVTRILTYRKRTEVSRERTDATI